MSLSMFLNFSGVKIYTIASSDFTIASIGLGLFSRKLFSQKISGQ
jgi:hypothetical protein